VLQFLSGAPQVKAAVDSQAWDIGIAGSVPNVIAGSQNIFTIGINNDESYTTEVVGAPGITLWPPTELRDSIFAGTPKSTGELLLRKCLELAGLDVANEHIMMAQQGDVMNALEQESDPQYACLWAPNTYTYREKYPDPRAKVFCSGRNVDFPIYGGLMVREDYGINNPDTVAKVLAAYLRGVTFMQNAELLPDVLEVSAAYHAFSGTPISENALKEDLILRPLFNLDAQLDHLNRNFANDYISEADKHYYALEDFLFEQGVIDNKFEPKEYVTDEYMKMVSADPELRAFSYYGTGVAEVSEVSEDDKLGAGPIVGYVVGAVGLLSLMMMTCVLASQKPATSAIVMDHERIAT
jgi:ABC-type nitrate/sulfonate/bicarbonate transport system substrate-binding protein